MSMQTRKEIVADFFRLISEGRPKDGLKYFAVDCVQHNPYTKGGMDALLDAMVEASKGMSSQAQYSDPELKVRVVLADGDMVAAYTQLLGVKSDPAKGGLRQVHLFRFKRNKIVEYWDVTQVITPDMPMPANAF